MFIEVIGVVRKCPKRGIGKPLTDPVSPQLMPTNRDSKLENRHTDGKGLF